MRAMILMAPAFLLAACLHDDGGRARIPADQAKTRLAFEYNNDFAQSATLAADETAMENDVAAACGGAKSALVGTALTFVIGKGVTFLVDQADKALQAEIAKYTAAYQASADVELYAASGDRLTLQHNCLRVTRMSVVDSTEKTKNPALKSELLMDLVAKIELHPAHTNNSFPSALRITPLRLYYATPAVKSGDNKYGVTAALDMEIFWRQDNRGFRQSDYPQVALLSETVDLNPDKKKGETEIAKWRYKSFIHGSDRKPIAAKDWPYRIAPLPAWTSYGAVDYGGNFVRAKVSVAEAGNVPWLLEKSAELVSDNKDSIEEKLREAIIKAAGLE